MSKSAKSKKAAAARESDPMRAPNREGDVLGVSDADPSVTIPKPANRGSGHATGLDVRQPTTGFADLKPGRGATGIDMGAAGEGTDIASHSKRPAVVESEHEDKEP
jgi:hypothetical protein